jgi:hypothetical protein
VIDLRTLYQRALQPGFHLSFEVSLKGLTEPTVPVQGKPLAFGLPAPLIAFGLSADTERELALEAEEDWPPSLRPGRPVRIRLVDGRLDCVVQRRQLRRLTLRAKVSA